MLPKLLLVSVLSFLPIFAFAETVELPADEPLITVDIPKSWKPTEIETGVSCESPDQVATIFFEITDEKGLKELIDANVEWLTEQDVKVDPATEKSVDFKIGEQDWSRISWDGDSKDWGPSLIGFMFTHAGEGKLLTVTYWVTKKDKEKQTPTLEKILSSVKPVSE